MSSFYTLLTITNNFPVDLTDGTATIKTGTLVGRIPETIEPEKKTTQIRINATNGLYFNRLVIETKTALSCVISSR